MTHKVNIRRLAFSPWMIIVLLALGWGPLFIAEFVRGARPDLDAEYRPQAFAMGWLGITMICSFLAVVFAIVHLLRLVVQRLGGNDRGGLNL